MNVILNSESLNAFSLRSETREDVHFHLFCSTLCTASHNAIRQDNEIKSIQIGMEEIKIFFLEGTWNKFIIDTEYNINTQKNQLYFCCRVAGCWLGQCEHGNFEGGPHYLQYLQHSLVSGQTTGREHSPAHQQKIGLNIYWAWSRLP